MTFNKSDNGSFIMPLVLVAGVLGGLLLVMAVIFFCKCCMHTPKPLKRQKAILNRATSGDRHHNHKRRRRERGLRECESLVPCPDAPSQMPSTAECQSNPATVGEEEENDIDVAFAEYKESLKATLVIENETTDSTLKGAADSQTTLTPTITKSGSPDGRESPPSPPTIVTSPPPSVRLTTPQLVHSKSLGYSSGNRYTEGDYHHLKKSKIDRSEAVAEFVKAHSMGSAANDDTLDIIIPESLRLNLPKSIKPPASPPPTKHTPPPAPSPTPATTPGPPRPLLREHPRSASSHSMQVYKEPHLTPPHFSSLQRIQRAYSTDERSSFPDIRAKSFDATQMQPPPHVRNLRGGMTMDDPATSMPTRKQLRQDDRIKSYSQERTRSLADTRLKDHHQTRSHTSLQLPGDDVAGSRLHEEQPTRSRLRRPSIGEIKAISPTLTRRINERVPYIKKQRSMSEDLPMSPLVHKERKQYSSKESLPAGSLHQVSVEVHHEPPSRFLPPIMAPTPSRLAVKQRDPYQSRSFELASHKDMYPQRRVKSYEVTDHEQVENHDRLEITQFMRGAIYNASLEVMSEGVTGELKSKVRYNDTGSLEDLNEPVPIDEIVVETLTVDDSETETSSTINGQNPKYKDLWNLRATLEEEEDLSDTIRMEDMVTSPDEQSAEEKDPGTSYTTSFESNTEPVIDPEHLVSDHAESCIASSNLLKPHQNRRQTYRTILNKRVKQTQSGQTSLESMETDGEVSDTSRHEVTTTSFESTTGTDNTDSTGDGSNASKLQQMRGDSGYKSLETQQSQGQTNDQPLKKQIQFIIEQDTIESADSGKASAADPVRSKLTALPIQAATAATAVTASGSTHHKHNGKDTKFDRRNGKTASKKRRDFHSERKAAAVKVYESIQEPESDSHSDKPSGDSFEGDGGGHQRKFSLFSRFIKGKSGGKKPTLARDYSIDSKTNALFHEFLRHDPVLDTGSGIGGAGALHPPRLSDGISISVPASFDMTGGGRRDRLSPGIRSASLGSDGSGAGGGQGQGSGNTLHPPNPEDNIEEEDEDDDHTEDERRRNRRRLSAARRRSMSESAATALAAAVAAGNIPVIKLPTEDDEQP